MARTVIRNANGEPLSKWKPADKFWYWFEQSDSSDMLDGCQKEYRFDPNRRWRFDYAWPEISLAVEIDGFGWGHQAQQNVSASNEKRNAAVAQGWRVLVYDTRLLGSVTKCQDAVRQVVECIASWD